MPTVKTHRFEIVGFSGDDPKATRARWHTVADKCREVVNVIWQQWELYHVVKGNDVKVQEFAAALRAYRNGDGKEKPKLDVKCMPPELGKIIYRKLRDRFPGVHNRAVELLRNITGQRMAGKDVDGRWAIWQAVLLNRQGRPNATHDQPIPFDKRSCEVVGFVEGKYTNYKLRIRLTAIPREKKAAASVQDEFQLKACGSGLAIVRRIASGEYDFCGSSIVYHSGKRKWFALVAYRMLDAATAGLDDKRTAVLHPGRYQPWSLWQAGYASKVGGDGRHVAAVRGQVMGQRRSRQQNYRFAGSANKGHGLHRAAAPWDKLSQRWKDFVKTYNHQTTSEVVRRCINDRVGVLVYLQPAGDKRDTRYLASAGKRPDVIEGSGWDWAQVATMLAYKCKEAGIHLVVRKCGDAKSKRAA